MKYKRILFCLMFFCLTMGMGVSAEAKTSTKKYMIKINKQQNVVTIYKQVKGKKYTPHKAFICSTGAATPIGTFHLQEQLRWHLLNGGHYGQYCSRIYRGFLFHSVWYHRLDKRTQSYVEYNRLGTKASQGCVRLTVADAKWIYENCPSGTKVVIYNSSVPGPLGKPKALKVSGFSGWDPTDPDSANPYWKKQPVITGVKNKTVRFGAKIKIKKGVRAKNSFGKKIPTERIRIKIRYKAPDKNKYIKVKKVNTRKTGDL